MLVFCWHQTSEEVICNRDFTAEIDKPRLADRGLNDNSCFVKTRKPRKGNLDSTLTRLLLF